LQEFLIIYSLQVGEIKGRAAKRRSQLTHSAESFFTRNRAALVVVKKLKDREREMESLERAKRIPVSRGPASLLFFFSLSFKADSAVFREWTRENTREQSIA